MAILLILTAIRNFILLVNFLKCHLVTGLVKICIIMPFHGAYRLHLTLPPCLLSCQRYGLIIELVHLVGLVIIDIIAILMNFVWQSITVYLHLFKHAHLAA